MYAIVKTGGKQYRVAPEDIIRVEKLDGEPGDVVMLEEVLMVGTDSGLEVGTPLVEGAAVSCEIVEQGRGKKIIIFKKKRRKHYRRKRGHRQHFTALKVLEILTGGAKPSVKPSAKKSAAKKDDKAAKKADDGMAAGKADEKAETAAASVDVEARAREIKEKLEKGEAVALFSAPEGEADDLKKISGVGPVIEKKLHALGIKTFEQVANFTRDDIAMVDAVLSFKGRIERDDWIGQAKKLAAEKKK